MKLHNKKHERNIALELPSGAVHRVPLPHGDFELPAIYIEPMKAHPVGTYYLKEMKPRKPRKKDADNSQDKNHDQPTSAEGD